MIETVGPHRILMGSDFSAGPKTIGERNRLPAWLNYLRTLPDMSSQYNVNFTSEEIDLIMGDNAQNILKI